MGEKASLNGTDPDQRFLQREGAAAGMSLRALLTMRTGDARQRMLGK
jgi:hypothetical protein